MALTYLKDAPDADLPKAVKISESDPGTDVGAYRWWGDPLPHGGPYTSVVLQLRNAANDGYITASQSVPWSAITGEPTTLAGYGITDAASATDLQDAVGPAWETLVDAATVEWDTLGAPYAQAKVTLGGNRTLDLQNMVAGAHGVLMVIQDGTGSRTLTLDGSNLHTITLSTAASAVDLLGWWYDGTTIRWAMLDQAGGGGGSGVAVEEDGSEEGTGIDRFDFTGDISLSVSGSQATVNVDLSAKAPLASPTFTGTPAAPTPTTGDNDTSIATTAFVQTALSPAFATLVDGATVTWATGGLRVNNARVTLGGNRTLDITGAVDGASGLLVVTQDGTGSRTLTLPAGSIEAGGSLALSTAAGSKDVLSWFYDGTNYFWTIAKAYA
jgi:hypothetical protein